MEFVLYALLIFAFFKCTKDMILEFNIGKYLGVETAESKQLDEAVNKVRRPLSQIIVAVISFSYVLLCVGLCNFYKLEMLSAYLVISIIACCVTTLSMFDQLRVYRLWLPSTFILIVVGLSDFLGSLAMIYFNYELVRCLL